MPTLSVAPASASDYQLLAEKRLPRALFDYIDGGAGREITLKSNTQDFDTLALNQNVMRDVSALDTELDLFGTHMTMPLALSPVGMGGMMRKRGEVYAARAAEKSGIPFTLSTVSICSMEEVAESCSTPFWFQLYMLKDRGHVQELLERAKAVGCRTLVFTVDLAVVGARYRDTRNGMGQDVNLYGRLRSGLFEYMTHPGWAINVGLMGTPHVFGNLTQYLPRASTPADFKTWLDEQIDPSVTWADIEWLRSQWDGDLLIKGVLSPDDARSAVDAGADAVIVSNHGGRQLDGVRSTIRVLPKIADAISDRSMILIDGGVRSGQDIVKALALGATAVMMGRPWIWALAAKGQAGLENFLDTIHSELKTTMALTGAVSVDQIASNMLAD